jgi:hypothetical protein
VVNGDDAFIFHSNSANPAATVRNIRPMALAVFRVFPPRSTRWNATLTVS